MRGIVQSGGTGGNVLPLNQARVTLFDVASGWPAVAGEAKTDRSGSFTIDVPSNTSAGIFYATANLGSGVVLMALLGPALPAAITINELTTVAAVYCAAQFIERRKLEGNPSGLRVAAAMSTNLVDVETGMSSPVLLSSPNADETNALRSTRALANVLASCVRDPNAARDVLFDLATPPGGRRPSDTISAMHNIARHPATHVEGIYEQSKAVEVYGPALVRAPDSWTLAVT